MNIVHTLFNMRMGGTETMLIDIMNRQVAAGNNVTLVLINKGHREEMLENLDRRVNIVRMNRATGSKNPLWLVRFNLLLRRLHPDAVHIHNKKALGMLYGPRRFRVVFTYHCNGDVNPYAGRADALCAISNTVAADVASRNEGDAIVVMNGIDTSAVSPRNMAVGELHAPVRLVQIGSLKHNIKGQHITLEALSKMRHKDVTIDFYGEGASRPMLEKLAADLGVERRVCFKGNRSRKELYEALAHYDIGLLPSLDEGFGLALAEPMAAGIPVVCSDLPGPMEVLEVTGAGRAAATGDSAALAAAIDNVIDDYARYSTEAMDKRGAIAANFDIVTTAAKYVDIYRGKF